MKEYGKVIKPMVKRHSVKKIIEIYIKIVKDTLKDIRKILNRYV